MPVQDYSINTKAAVEGMLYGMHQTRADIQTAFAEELGISYGKAVKNGTTDRGVLLGVDGTHVLGVVLRQDIREAATRPSDGTYVIGLKETIPMLQDGRFTALIVDGGAITRGQQAYVDSVTGKFYVAAGANRVLATNVTFSHNLTLAAGEITDLLITNAVQVPAPVAP